MRAKHPESDTCEIRRLEIARGAYSTALSASGCDKGGQRRGPVWQSHRRTARERKRRARASAREAESKSKTIEATLTRRRDRSDVDTNIRHRAVYVAVATIVLDAFSVRVLVAAVVHVALVTRHKPGPALTRRRKRIRHHHSPPRSPLRVCPTQHEALPHGSSLQLSLLHVAVDIVLFRTRALQSPTHSINAFGNCPRPEPLSFVRAFTPCTHGAPSVCKAFSNSSCHSRIWRSH